MKSSEILDVQLITRQFNLVEGDFIQVKNRHSMITVLRTKPIHKPTKTDVTILRVSPPFSDYSLLKK